MGKPKGTLWPLEPHTKGKHLVLEAYLNAWLAITSRWNKRILFVDGFAGPGRYKDGERGSPLIALDAFKGHKYLNHSEFEIVFHFIENEMDRVEYLEQEIETIKEELPDNCNFHIHVEHGTFDETLTEVLDDIDQQNQMLAPSFIMIDPFGVSHTPMRLIERIMGNNKSEVYISFMYEWINRFSSTAEFEDSMDDLYGCREWRDSVNIWNKDEKKRFFFDLYKSQLKAAGAQYVVHFELYRGNELVYAIFFGTKSLIGCDKMKQAIWKIAPFGDYAFRGIRGDQTTLDFYADDFQPFQKELQSYFKGKDWVTIEDIMEFARSDKTDYHTGHVKTKALRPLEEKGLIEVRPTDGSKRRKNSYTDGKTEVRFL